MLIERLLMAFGILFVLAMSKAGYIPPDQNGSAAVIVVLLGCTICVLGAISSHSKERPADG